MRGLRGLFVLWAAAIVALAIEGAHLLLAGSETAGTTGTFLAAAAEVPYFVQVEAVNTGILTALHVIISAEISGQLRMALWSDSSNLPGASLAEGSISETSGKGTTLEVPIAGGPEVKTGTKYWIAWSSSPLVKVRRPTTPTTLVVQGKNKHAKISENTELAGAAETLGPVGAWATGEASGIAVRPTMLIG